MHRLLADEASSRYVMVTCTHTAINSVSESRIRPAPPLTVDHVFPLFPGIDTPFQDRDDVDRLLPYDVFQHPRENLFKANKPERRATEPEILQSELAGTYLLRVRCSFPCSWSIQKQKLH
jgi:hypothetical protein